MKKYILIYCLLLGLVSSVEAQNIKIEGRLVNMQKEAIQDVTIRCFLKDSVFLKGVVSNAKGRFSIEIPSKGGGYNLFFTSIGYMENRIFIKTGKEDIHLGDVVLQEDVHNLGEVSVTGKQSVRTNEKLMTFPTKEQLRHASDGYGALYNLMIPHLSVDIFNKSVSTREGNATLCINGREATVDEVQNLNPKDIERVDFYEMGHPNYPDAFSVVDYILVVREGGGTVALNGKQQSNRVTGGYGATAQFFKKKSEIAVSVYDGYNNFSVEDGNQSLTNFKYSDGNIVKKEQKGLLLDEKGNNFKTYLNYIYRDKKNSFYASARLGRRSGDNENTSMEMFSNRPYAMTMNDARSTVILNPSGKIFYERKFKYNQTLRINLLASNNDNSYTRHYLAKEEETTYSEIMTDVSEKYFYINPSVNYTKTFKCKGTLAVSLDHHQHRTHSRYITDGELQDAYLMNGESFLFLSYQQSFKKLFLRLRWGDAFVYTNNKLQSRFWHSFFPQLNFRYRITPKQTLDFSGSLRGETPKLSYLSTVEQQMDFMQSRKGNPDLKNRKMTNGMLSYTLDNKWGTISFFGAYVIVIHDFYEKIDQEEDKFIHTYLTGDTWYNLNGGGEIKWKLIPRKLTFTMNIEGNHQMTNTWKKMQVSNFVWAANVLFIHKGFMASANCVTATKLLLGGSINKIPFRYNFNFGYNISGLNIQLSMCNPFSSVAKKVEYLSPSYDNFTKEYTRRFTDHLFYFTLNYRFSFGKKHKYDNSNVEDTEKSAILKAY